MIIAGIEEAGRGPVIGPMVMAICSIEDSKEHLLRKIGVKDSKLLSPLQRKRIFEEIKKLCKYKIIILLPKEIDLAVENPAINLNGLEARTSAKLINKLEPRKVILDCPSNNPLNYKNYVKSMVKDKDIKIIAEHKADVNYPIVGAASILAKVTRDAEIEKLKKEHKVDFGSGYPSDPRTQKFIKENWNKYDFFRKTWSTYKRIAQEKAQKGLGDF